MFLCNPKGAIKFYSKDKAFQLHVNKLFCNRNLLVKAQGFSSKISLSEGRIALSKVLQICIFVALIMKLNIINDKRQNSSNRSFRSNW